MSNKIFHSWGIIPINILEVVLILRNSSLKLKTVAAYASLLNYTVSSEKFSQADREQLLPQTKCLKIPQK